MFQQPESRRQMIDRYAQSGAVAITAITLRYLLDPHIADTGFITFFAVLLIAWVGGLGPAIFWQTVLIIATVLFSDPATPAEPISLKLITGLLAYYSLGIVVALLSEARHAAMQRVARQTAKIERQDEELRATISGLGDALVVADRDGRISLMNPVAESLTNWSQGEALGLPLESVFRIHERSSAADEAPNPLVDLFQQEQGLRESRILFLTARDGREVPVSFNATPIRNPAGDASGTVVILRDETERLRGEEQLRQMNVRKDDFLATLAHELRNPLAPIRTGLQLLKLSKNDATVAAEVQQIMERQVHHIIRLVDDLLDVSRISRGKLQLRTSPTNFSRIVENAVETMRPQAEEARHELVVSLPPLVDQVEADPDRLTQIACNLLHNAIKFTPHGGRIEVRVEHVADEAQLVVSDNGAGIRPENLESIFEMFNQGMLEKERGKMGLGVGLTLARRLAELHGGTVEAASDGINCGSTFRLRLPVSKRFPMVDAPPSDRPQFASLRRRKVLLVDDNEDGLRTMEMMLQSLGHETFIAHDGAEALQVAKRVAPEIVFMDLGMPVMNGYEAAPRLRELFPGGEMLIIALTGWGQEKDRKRTAQAGFDDHLVKPVELEALRSCLERKGREHLVVGRPS